MTRDEFEQQYSYYCETNRGSDDPADIIQDEEEADMSTQKETKAAEQGATKAAEQGATKAAEQQPKQEKQENTVPQSKVVTAALEQLLGNVSQYPLQNVTQRFMQSMTTEIARARFLADRIQLGDEALFDVSKPERPGVDQPDGKPGEPNPRTLSERQYELLVQCQEDEAELTAALVEIKTFYTAMFGEEQPVYAIQENKHGGWDQVTDFQKALDVEYRKEHQRWLRRQSEPQREGFTAEGAQHMMEEAKKRAEKLAGNL